MRTIRHLLPLMALLASGAGAQTVGQQAAAAARAAAGSDAVVAPANAAALAVSYAPVARRAQPAVVNIFTARTVRQRGTGDPFFDFFFNQGRAAPPRVDRSLGSGVIVDASGLVVTNNHVVAGADQILVALPDRREYAAKLLFADPRTDLALLKVEPSGSPLPTLPLANSDGAEVGDVVLAIGNPFGVGQTVTQGIVSATARTGIGISDYQFFIQTDAPINPGNSGGALVNTRGELIGVNTAIFSRTGTSAGIGFAIPSNMVRIFLANARQGRLVNGWVGFEGEALTAASARGAGLEAPTGVLLTAVTPGSPAAAAGLRAGDIVYAVDGREVTDPGQLRYRLATQPVGTTVTLTIIRAGAVRNERVRLAAPPEVPARQLTQLPGGTLLAGVTLGNLSPAFAQELGAGLPERGVVVVQVAPGAPAARLGLLQVGDVIEGVNGRPVATVGEVQSQLTGAASALTFRFSRGGSRGECSFRAPNQIACRDLGAA